MEIIGVMFVGCPECVAVGDRVELVWLQCGGLCLSVGRSLCVSVYFCLCFFAYLIFCYLPIILCALSLFVLLLFPGCFVNFCLYFARPNEQALIWGPA